MGCWLNDWSRRGSVLVRRSYTLATAPVQVFGPDPYRYAVTIFGTNALPILYNFSLSAPTNFLFQVNTFAYAGFLTEGEAGDLIKLPLWAWTASGTAVGEWVSLSYNPERRRVYEQWLDGQLSNLGALGLTP